MAGFMRALLRREPVSHPVPFVFLACAAPEPGDSGVRGHPLFAKQEMLVRLPPGRCSQADTRGDGSQQHRARHYQQ